MSVCGVAICIKRTVYCVNVHACTSRGWCRLSDRSIVGNKICAQTQEPLYHHPDNNTKNFHLKTNKNKNAGTKCLEYFNFPTLYTLVIRLVGSGAPAFCPLMKTQRSLRRSLSQIRLNKAATTSQMYQWTVPLSSVHKSDQLRAKVKKKDEAACLLLLKRWWTYSD